MNKSAFLKLIQESSNISDQLTDELEKVAVAFPYCQTAHLLLAKSAHEKGSMLSTQKLRRAAAYATDRQLLKKIIYTTPSQEPVFVEPATEAETHTEKAVLVDIAVDEAVVIDPFSPDEDVITTEATVAPELMLPEEPAPVDEVSGIAEAIPAEEAENTMVVADEANAPEDEYAAYTAAEEEPDTVEADFESELAMLLTFNSLSSSSTDLLAVPELEADEVQETEQYTSAEHLIETEEALAELEFLDAPATEHELFVEEETPAPAVDPFEASYTEEEAKEQDNVVVADATAIVADEDVAAPINYSSDEIDRLYAEDALGYWMGSSRMGEMLQLKDEYTRQKPFDFHPELILEYSKTHEMEKQEEPVVADNAHQFDIIDHFLKLNPRLNSLANARYKAEPQEDLSLKSSKIKKGMASENLANIFLKQGKVKKAVKIYEQLILKYPEKKSYFAEQIEKLQNIT